MPQGIKVKFSSDLTILFLPVNEPGITLHFFVSVSMFYNFRIYVFHFLIKFAPRYFILFDVIFSKIALLLSPSEKWTHCQNMEKQDFCVLILQLFWIHLLVMIILVETFGFSIYGIIPSAETDSFTSFFLTWMLLFLFDCYL